MIIPGNEVRKDKKISADVCIVGSGAAGGVLAMKIAESGKNVVVLEKGAYYTKENFNQREADMIPKLWKSSGLQFSLDFSVNVIQGMCVGGSTVINDAICFETPKVILELWRDKYGVRGLSPKDVEREKLFEEVYEFLNNPKFVEKKQFNKNNEMLRKGCNALGFKEGVDHGPNRRNCVDCRECGFCHLGCYYDTKQSMLVTTIPKAVANGADVYANCEVQDVAVKGGKARGVVGYISKGKSSHRLEIESKVVIISAGTIASSEILLRNNINPGGMVGRHVSLHPSPSLIAEFDEEINPHRGIPMAYHFSKYSILNGLNQPGYMIESVFVQPFQISLALPGFGYDQKEFMSRLIHYAMAGILLRDEPSGTVSLNVNDEAILEYRLSKSDGKKMIEAMKMGARIFFAAGAKKVITSHRNKTILYSEDDLFRLDQSGVGSTDISLISAHPQGGNRMAETRPSVVDSRCRVRGTKNLLVCDASVFPTAVGVNPQITVMSLATHVAKDIVQNPSEYF